ncbi:hypothetical protein AYO43_01325 [Nitrospira sp. SCGC AG-212-E16]|nr:hypothetical protein AYO43_01325 [Nitrospira sp. SCGC AG-212-E16]
MRKWTCFIAAAIVASTATPMHALNLSAIMGTMEVEFQPMQSAGIKEGCTLVYRVIGQDHAYRKGNLITLTGNIAYHTNLDRSSPGLSLKIGTIDTQAYYAQLEPPSFAYIQTPHGTTARSKFVQADGEPGFRRFTFELDEDTVKVLADISSGTPVTIGFNRRKGGLDVLIPLDLRVAATTVYADGSMNRRQSDDMLYQFALCNVEVTEQVQKQLQGK